MFSLLTQCLAATVGTTAASSSGSIAIQELNFFCSDGTKLAAQRYSYDPSFSTTKLEDENQKTETILCLHGWMDNCRSFHALAPFLVENLNESHHPNHDPCLWDVIALDLPGHGCSSHKSRDAPPMVQAEMIHYVREAIHAVQRQQSNQQPKPLTLIGHSLGAAIASLYTASFPEDVKRLVLLEGAGFLARDPSDTALHVREHVTKRMQQQKRKKPTRIYKSMELAILTRIQAARRMPGKQTLSYEAAEQLVQRSTISVIKKGGTNDDATETAGVQFRHDHRFQWPSIQYMTWSQNESIFETVKNNENTECCLLLADDGWPFDSHELERTLTLLRPRTFESLPGSHYFHADPVDAPLVAKTVLNFLLRTSKPPADDNTRLPKPKIDEDTLG